MAAAGPHRILIIDDEKIISTTLAHIFSAKGYDVRAANSGEQALALLDTWIPHVAIVDVMLPGMDGVDVAIHLTACCPDVRILMISGLPDSVLALKRWRHDDHGLELLAKPVHPQCLLDRTAELLA